MDHDHIHQDSLHLLLWVLEDYNNLFSIQINLFDWEIAKYVSSFDSWRE
jgi:hypothetical protein